MNAKFVKEDLNEGNRLSGSYKNDFYNLQDALQDNIIELKIAMKNLKYTQDIIKRNEKTLAEETKEVEKWQKRIDIIKKQIELKGKNASGANYTNV